MAFTTSGLTAFVVALTVSAAPILFGRKSKWAEAKASENGEKYIDYSPWIIGFFYIASVSFVLMGILVYLFSDEPWAGIAFAVMGFLCIIPTLILQFSDTTINWSNDYIRGAKSGTRLKKNTILWADVVFVKFHPNKTIQIQDKSGKSVYWTVYHSGWYRIIEDLKRYRPDIDISDFE